MATARLYVDPAYIRRAEEDAQVIFELFFIRQLDGVTLVCLNTLASVDLCSSFHDFIVEYVATNILSSNVHVWKFFLTLTNTHN